MPVYFLNDQLYFPPVEDADKEGLLAVGGDLSPERLLLAYQSGIFPWFNEDEIILWWSPNPRFVLFPNQLYISKSMRKIIKQNVFSYTINQNFEAVINQCATINRKDQEGTWITQEMKKAYTKLHQIGYAQSVEVWQDNHLVGGLYGILIGNCFFGESMFQTVSNASKFGFIQFVQHLEQLGVVIIDCQIHTQHLESLGASFINRSEFIHILQKNIHK
ncbi:MAG: leucyl/phenylalanyl-tRNA--protein transferase [Chitinophagales bacterium]|nr:leucyl/phenylalanyl-tRNA--protein transferase [Chitinophagales bacterium]